MVHLPLLIYYYYSGIRVRKGFLVLFFCVVFLFLLLLGFGGGGCF